MSIGSRILALLREHPPLRSRWPLYALVAASLAVVLVPLLLDVFFAIPWPVRKLLGQAVVLVLIALGIRRVLRVGPGDSRPLSRVETPEPVGIGRAERWLPWALQLAVASFALPLL